MDRPDHRPPEAPPVPADRLERLLDAASEALEDGRAEDALSRAEDALALGPRSVPALHLRAAALADLGRTAEAREAFDRALGPGKDDPDLLAGAADFLVNGLPEEESERVDLERGLELARRGSRRTRRAGDPALAAELALLEGQALGQLGRLDEGLARLAAAARDAPDRADVRLEQGIALYELCRFEEARAALLAAAALDPEEPWVEHYRGLVAERTGLADEARRHLERARRLAPGEFPRPVALSPAAFDAAVEDALAALPEAVRRYLANVAVTVEDLPADDDLRASDPPLSPAILGLFRGAPYGQKSSMDPWSHLPSSIVLYQRNLERLARSRAELIEEIRVTLAHEVGHFLGLDEDELYERGLE
jgi:predicted Zn-dependent protease with MMP-like domain/Flp pilus assembly protein TadD